MSYPTPSRLHVNCDYCGDEMRKKIFKEHTTRVHGKNVHPQERHETSGQPKLSFWKRPAEVDDNEQNENIQKKINLEVDLNNSTDLYTDEGETEGKPEGEPETESFNMASFVRALSEAKDEIKHDVNLAKEEVLAKMETQSGIRKQKEFEKPDEDNRDIQILLNNARNIEEICSLFTEIVYHQDKDIIRSKLCASEQDIKYLHKKTPGIKTYKQSEDTIGGTLSDYFSNVNFF